MVGAHRRHILIALASLVSPSNHRHPDNLATAGGKFAFYIDFCYNVLMGTAFHPSPKFVTLIKQQTFQKEEHVAVAAEMT